MPNGGEGTMESNSYAYGDYCTIKSNNFTKKNHTFEEWTTNSNGVSDGYYWTGWSGTWNYLNGQFGIKDNKLILYAIWKKIDIVGIGIEDLPNIQSPIPIPKSNKA